MEISEFVLKSGHLRISVATERKGILLRKRNRFHPWDMNQNKWMKDQNLFLTP